MSISKEAVEAAVRVLVNTSHWDGGFDAIPEALKDQCRDLARQVLEAATRHVKEDAWDEGAVAEANRWMKTPVNPYRDAA